jgi:TRAP-type C4-dicarboxylate transport system substrate-binding protein
VVYCNHAFNRLADLRGRRVRVSSVSQADLMDALGAKPVFTQFADMVPQMREGTLDCAITGTMSGHTNGLYQVTTHLHTMAINWGLSVFGANASAWAALPADLRTLLAAELPRLEQAIWDDADRATDEGVACNSGQASGARCATTTPGRMVVVRPAADDAALMRALLARSVLPRWVTRCGPACGEAWNQSLAAVVGLQAGR